MAMVNGTTFGINQSLFVSKNTHYQTKEITHFPSISRTDVYVSQPDDSARVKYCSQKGFL